MDCINESCRFTVPYCLNGGRLGRKMIAIIFSKDLLDFRRTRDHSGLAISA
jgi:hypothetical protein